MMFIGLTGHSCQAAFARIPPAGIIRHQQKKEILTRSMANNVQISDARVEPAEAARQAKLRYVLDDRPGITRRKRGKSFQYLDPDGSPIRDPDELKRIASLAIPPAWTEVWICPNPNGHLQATGRDARNRKQYRYHPRWHEVRDESKFDRMLEFGRDLPAIRERVEQDLRRKTLCRERVLAAVVRLLETTFIRVGNDEYAKQNRSYGLTTMKDRHADVTSTTVHFRFRGKSGKKREVRLQDRRLARVVKQCRDIPGQELFQYYDGEGERRDVRSEDVNEYLREISGKDYTAKDFRTWAGTVLACLALQEAETFDNASQAKKNVTQAVKKAAERLGNTPAICRKSYIHPAIIETYMEGGLAEALKRRVDEEMDTSLADLEPEEAAVLALLSRRLQVEQQRLPKAS